ncbi:MAG: hypothetical protein KJ971_03825 [Firmicutes bacterium]|nr:hypothetical protein [Bacillota bacterium]
MEKYSLTTTPQKITCVFIDFLFLCINVLTLYTKPIELGYLIGFFLFSIVLCGIYTSIIFFSFVKIDSRSKTVYVRLIQQTIIHLEIVRNVALESKVVQNQDVNSLVFYDGSNKVIGEINTFLLKKNLPIVDEILQKIKELI